MTVFRNRFLFPAAVAAALAAGTALAAPRSLLPVPGIGDGLPPLRDEAPSPPPVSEPGGQGTAAPPAASSVPSAPPASSSGGVGASQPPAPGGIQIGSLRAPDPASVALIATGEGLGVDMWQGMARADIAALLEMAAHPVRSPALARLFRRLLLTGAEIPPPAPGEEESDILALRLQALMAIGDTPSVRQLAAVSPGREDDPLFRRLTFEARVTDEGLAAACPLAAQALADDIGSGHTALYWEKTAALCQAVTGNEAAARLAGDLLREEGLDDPRFFALLDLLTGMDVQIAAFEKPGIVEAAALAAAGHPQEVTMADRPALLRLTALQAPPGPVRARAALLAAAYGLIGPQALKEAMKPADTEKDSGAVPAPAAAPSATPPAEVTEEAGSGEDARRKEAAYAAFLSADNGVASLMDLYAALSKEDETLTDADAAMREKLLLRLLELGEEQGVLTGVAMLARDVMAAIPPDGARARLALALGRASLAAGDADRAYEWLKALQRRIAASRQEVGGAVDQAAVAALLRLWPLFQIADPARRLPTDSAALAQWSEAVLDGIFPPRAVETALTLFAVSGTDAGDAAWKRLQPGEVRQGLAISPAGLRALKAAMTAGRRGETVLLILHFMGDWPAGALDAAGEGLLVHALFRLGLVEDAQALAAEVLLADGF